MNIFPFQAIYPKIDLISSFDSFIKSAKTKYPQYLETGFYQKHNTDAIYIYEIKFASKTIYGILCGTAIQNLIDGKALKHENTIASKEQDTLDYIMQRQAFIKPLLLAHQVNKKLDNLKKKNLKKKNILLSFKLENGVSHKFYQIDDGAIIEDIRKIFKDHINQTFIADGHHRSSASKLLYTKSQDSTDKKYTSILTAYFNISDLEIWDYNRIINGLNQITATQLMAKLSVNFDIKYLKKPYRLSDPDAYLMYIHREWYELILKPKTKEKWQKKHQPLITTTILNDLIFKQIFNVKDVRFDDKIKYVQGTQSFDYFEQKVESILSNVGFCFTPVSKEAFMEVAKQGNVLPPKSTWFEPRLVNGMLNQEL